MIDFHFTLSYFEIYLIVINMVTFLVYGFDKLEAILNKRYLRRVSEITLLSLCFVGGVIGGLVAIILFRHKISKVSFLVKFIGIIIFQIIFIYLIYRP